jgi:hypothetical protein
MTIMDFKQQVEQKKKMLKQKSIRGEIFHFFYNMSRFQIKINQRN